MNPKVSVNILNWNQPIDTIECLESCQKLDYENYQLVVIDNHSTDNSIELFRKRFPKVHLIENNTNLGYAGGNNVGIKHAIENGAEYVLILNNDITAEPNILWELIQAMKENPKAGMAAPKVMYYDRRSVINSLGTRMNWFRLRPYLGECNQTDDGKMRAPQKKDILVGCALFVSKETIDRIGFLDENFFLVHEEADWCYRNLRSGFQNMVVPTAVVYHKASKTIGKYPEMIRYYDIRNFLYLASKNASPLDRLKVWGGLACLMLKHAVQILAGGNEQRKIARAFFYGVQDYFASRMGRSERFPFVSD